MMQINNVVALMKSH